MADTFAELVEKFLDAPGREPPLTEEQKSLYRSHLNELHQALGSNDEATVEVSNIDFGIAEENADADVQTWRHFYKWVLDTKRRTDVPFYTLLDVLPALIEGPYHYRPDRGGDDPDASAQGASYGEFEPRRLDRKDQDQAPLWYTIAEWNDHSISPVSRANWQWIQDNVADRYFGTDDPLRRYPELVAITGGFNSNGFAIRSTWDEIDFIEAISALDDYPLFDDSILNEVEMEFREEAWPWLMAEWEQQIELATELDIAGLDLPPHTLWNLWRIFEVLTNLEWHYDAVSGYPHRWEHLFDEFTIEHSPAVWTRALVPEERRRVLEDFAVQVLGVPEWMIDQISDGQWGEILTETPYYLLEPSTDELRPLWRRLREIETQIETQIPALEFGEPVPVEPRTHRQLTYQQLRSAIDRPEPAYWEADPEIRREGERVSEQQQRRQQERFADIPRSILRRRAVKPEEYRMPWWGIETED